MLDGLGERKPTTDPLNPLLTMLLHVLANAGVSKFRALKHIRKPSTRRDQRSRSVNPMSIAQNRTGIGKSRYWLLLSPVPEP